jgi:hypothetical protein
MWRGHGAAVFARSVTENNSMMAVIAVLRIPIESGHHSKNCAAACRSTLGRGLWTCGQGGAEDFGAEVSAIAVPVKIGDRVIACVNPMWATGTKNAQDFAKQNLDALRTVADDLAIACKQDPQYATLTALAKH